MKKYLLIRMMQTVAIILFAANVSAQNQNVVISVRNIPVRTTLTQIRQAANVHFVYEEKNINSQQTVTLNYPQGTSLSTLLNNLCKQIGLTYEINESVILLYPAQKQTTTHDIHILLLERGNKQPLPMATCVLNPLGAYAATDMEGKAVLKNVPTGKYILNISYVGFETVQREINVEQNLDLTIRMSPTSLALKEVVVVAKQNAAGESTSSIIGRQAIDHLQAMSLDDVMQLIPGHLMKNTDLTSRSNVQLRTLVNNNTNAFGSSIIMDGVPMSNNGTLSQGGFSSTAFVGTDLRQISADDIESVEIIRGIPSAEYGCLLYTSDAADE